MTEASASAGAKSAGESDDDVGPVVEDRDQMLTSLDVAIEEAQRKIESGRVYDAENEKVRIKWIRCLAYAMNVRRQIAQDRDLEEIAERLDRLEKQNERES
jgi:hypothetical protein